MIRTMWACRREADRLKRIEEARQYAVEERMAQEAAGAADLDASASDSEQEEMQQPDSLFCIACDKSFKSEGAFRNHGRWGLFSADSFAVLEARSCSALYGILSGGCLNASGPRENQTA